MPPKQKRVAGTEGQQNSKVEPYKYLKNYKLLKKENNDITKGIKNVFENNIWKLKERCITLKEYYEELNYELKGVSWLNEIQYLDIPEEEKVSITRRSLRDLLNGNYKTINVDSPNTIATEKGYGNRVKFWTKSFKSLEGYDGYEDLSWVVEENNQILYELMRYHNEKNNSLSSLQGDLKALTRVIKLLLGPEHELTYKYGALQINLLDVYNITDDQNKITTKRELKSFIPYEQLLDILDGMEKKYKELIFELPQSDRKNGLKHSNTIFQLHQLIVALSLYVYTFPSRHENLDLEMITDIKEAKADKNYVLINMTGPSTIIYNEIVKTHKPHKYRLASKQLQSFHNKLNTLLKNSYKLYPRKYLFIAKNKWSNQVLNKVSHSTVSEWLMDLIKEKNINITGLRSSFISYWWPKWNNQQKTICVRHMRTSKDEAQRAYLKFYNNPDELIKVKLEPDMELLMNTSSGTDKDTGVIVDDKDNKIDKSTNKGKAKAIIVNLNKDEKRNDDGMNKLQRYLSDPEKAKKHRERVKEYGKNEMNIARRYVRELSSGILDFKKMRDNTKDKYKIKQDENGNYYTDL